MPSSVICAIAALAVFSFSVAAQNLEVGKPAPPVNLERTIPATGHTSFETLKGKPTVIEFWATWCAYCIEEIPHLNALAGKFGDVRFLSITDEQPSIVESFLAKRPISGAVGIDRNGSTFKAYGIEGRPQTVLVDKDGVVRGILYP
ncbi:MAG: TlpA family protein disulfide reductase, partial [Bryobacterales bacterium]|nr:TlpA family protein disulfide reductase [Bryobacterales bacterium]